MASGLLPHIMAVINAATIAALLRAYRLIKSGNEDGHRKSMYVAVILGACFLVLYLSYHFGHGLAKFGGQGMIRPVYFGILIIHILAAGVAAIVVPLTVYRALAGDFARHRRIVRLAWPLWMFVAVSGLVVYAMTIHLWPYQGA